MFYFVPFSIILHKTAQIRLMALNWVTKPYIKQWIFTFFRLKFFKVSGSIQSSTGSGSVVVLAIMWFPWIPWLRFPLLRWLLLLLEFSFWANALLVKWFNKTKIKNFHRKSIFLVKYFAFCKIRLIYFFGQKQVKTYF